MKTQTVFNLEHTRNYAAIGNSTLQNTQLSDFSYRVHIYLISLPSDWRVFRQHLANHFNVSVRKVQYALTELSQCRLVEYVRLKKRPNRDQDDGFYRVYEVAKETLKHHKIKVKKAKQTKEKPNIAPNKLTDLFTDCIDRLKKGHDLDTDDENTAELACQDFADTNQGKIRASGLYNWVLTAMLNGRKTRQRTEAIGKTMDRRAAKTATVIHAQTNNMKTPATEKSTLEKLTDRSWAEGLMLEG